MNVYDFKAVDIDGEEVNFSQYQGKVLIIVNTASKCGFTPQYQGLEKIYQKYRDQGFEILGFPSNQFSEQEPGTNKDVKSFCELNYGVTFPLFEKTDVRGETAHPLFKYLTDQKEFKGFDPNHEIGKILGPMLADKYPEILEGDGVKWNFTKFLVDKKGNVIDRFESSTEPEDMESTIVELLKA